MIMMMESFTVSALIIQIIIITIHTIMGIIVLKACIVPRVKWEAERSLE